MMDRIDNRTKRYLSNHKKRNRLRMLVCLLSLCVITGVYGLLIIPAVSREINNPLIETESAYALYGETIPLKVSATAESGSAETIFLLSAQELGAGLSSEYVFDENGETPLVAVSGNTVILHKEMQEDGTVQYWFSLPENSTEKLTLNCVTPPLTTITREVDPTTETEVPETTPDTEPVVSEQPDQTSAPSEDTGSKTPEYVTETVAPTEAGYLKLSAASATTLVQAQSALTEAKVTTYSWLLTQEEVDAVRKWEKENNTPVSTNQTEPVNSQPEVNPAITQNAPQEANVTIATIQQAMDQLPEYAQITTMTTGSEEWNASHLAVEHIQEMIAQLTDTMNEAEYAAFEASIGTERLFAYNKILMHFAQAMSGDITTLDDYNYKLSLAWKDGGTVYNDVSQSTDLLDLKYELTISVSNGVTYPAGQMQVDIPLSLMEYRDLTPTDDTDDKFCDTVTFSIPQKGTTAAQTAMLQYELVTTGTKKFVRITNVKELVPGNQTIQLGFMVERQAALDGSIHSLNATAKANGMKNNVAITEETATSNAIVFTENTGITLNSATKSPETANVIPNDSGTTDSAAVQGGRIHTWDTTMYGEKPVDFDSYRWAIFTVTYDMSGNQPANMKYVDTPSNGGEVYALTLDYPDFTGMSHRDSTVFNANGILRVNAYGQPRGVYSYSNLTYNTDGSASIEISPFASESSNGSRPISVGGAKYWYNASSNSKVTLKVIVRYPTTTTQLTNTASITMEPVDKVDKAQTATAISTINWKDYQFIYNKGILSVWKGWGNSKSVTNKGGLFFLRNGIDGTMADSSNYPSTIQLTATKWPYSATSASNLTGDGTNGKYQLELGDDFLFIQDATQTSGYYRLKDGDYSVSSFNKLNMDIYDVDFATGVRTYYTAEQLANMVQFEAKVKGTWTPISLPTNWERGYTLDGVLDQQWMLLSSDIIYLPEGTTDIKVIVNDLKANTYCSIQVRPVYKLHAQTTSYLYQYLNKDANATLAQIEVFNLDYTKLYVGQTDGSYVWNNLNISAANYNDIGDKSNALTNFIMAQDIENHGKYVQREWAKIILEDISWEKVSGKAVKQVNNGASTGTAVYYNELYLYQYAKNVFSGITGEAFETDPSYQPLRDALSDYSTQVFYDLLPEGVSLDTSRATFIRKASGWSEALYGIVATRADGVYYDDIDCTYEIVSDNYNGSHRQLIKITVTSNPTVRRDLSTVLLNSPYFDNIAYNPNYGTNGSTSVYYSGTLLQDRTSTSGNGATLSKDAVNGYRVYFYTTSSTYNLAAENDTQRTNIMVAQYGNAIPLLSGLGSVDDGTAVQSYTGLGTDGKAVLNNLGKNPDTTAKNTVYATFTYPFNTAMTMNNQVKVEVSGTNNPSEFKTSVTAMGGKNYIYKISYQNGTGITKNLILYDYLETATETGEGFWKGTPVSIDVSDIFNKTGIHPTVYYSTVENAAPITGTPGTDWQIATLTNDVYEFGEGNSVKAIAIDCGAYEFTGVKEIYAKVTMLAPITPIVTTARYAYNKVSMQSDFRTDNTANWIAQNNTSARVRVNRTVEKFNITITKTVTGNMGDRNKEFNFTVTLTDPDGNPLSGTYQYIGDKTGSITLDAEGKATFTLKDQESITIRSILFHSNYSVTEDNYSSEGYTTTVDTTKDKATDTDLTANKKIGFINHSSITVATGVTLHTQAYFLLFALSAGIAVCYGIASKRHRRKSSNR